MTARAALLSVSSESLFSWSIRTECGAEEETGGGEWEAVSAGFYCVG